MLNANQILETARSTVKADEAVILSYLFGSAAGGHVGPLSDIDIGVLLTPNSHAYGQLMDNLCLALQTDRVDLIPLHEAPVPLRYRVIQNGILLYCADDKSREDFESDTVRRYLDFKPIRDRAFKAARKHLLGEI